jgi:hypothetical protein
MATLVFETSVRDWSAKPLRIYRLAPPRVTDKTVSDSARLFGLMGNPRAGTLAFDAEHHTYSEGPFDVIVYHASGAVRFRDRTKWQRDDGHSNSTITDEQAVKLARRFISRRSLAPLKELRVFKIAHLRVGAMGRESKV